MNQMNPRLNERMKSLARYTWKYLIKTIGCRVNICVTRFSILNWIVSKFEYWFSLEEKNEFEGGEGRSMRKCIIIILQDNIIKIKMNLKFKVVNIVIENSMSLNIISKSSLNRKIWKLVLVWNDHFD